jgi:hypothetical protein
MNKYYNSEFFSKIGHILIVAPTTSGKTIFTKYLYKKLKKKYCLNDENTYIFTNNKKEWIEFKNVTSDNKLEKLYNRCNGSSTLSKYTVIFDDFTENEINTHTNQHFIKYFVRGRHKGIRVIMLIQYLKQVGPKIRSNCQYICISTSLISNLKNLRECSKQWFEGNTNKLIKYLKKSKEKLGEYSFLSVDIFNSKYDAFKAPNPDNNNLNQEYTNAKISKTYNNSGFFNDQSITNISGDINAKTLIQRNKIHNEIRIQNIKMEKIIKVNDEIDRIEELCYKNYPNIEEQIEIVKGSNKFLRPVPLYNDTEWSEAGKNFIKWNTNRKGEKYIPIKSKSKVLSIYNGLKNINPNNRLDLAYGTFNFVKQMFI